jgi:hypothetical protein
MAGRYVALALCSYSTTNSLTYSGPTSDSSMLKHSILLRFTVRARIASAPMAKALSRLRPPRGPQEPQSADPCFHMLLYVAESA